MLCEVHTRAPGQRAASCPSSAVPLSNLDAGTILGFVTLYTPRQVLEEGPPQTLLQTSMQRS